MKRRRFTQILSFGAGSMSFLSVAAQETDGSTDEQSQDDDRDDQAVAATGSERVVSASSPQPVKVEDYIALSQAKLPKATFDYITTGSADEITLRENVAAFRRIKVLPPLLTGVAKADLSTRVLNERISLPVMLAPVAALGMYHPQGALAAASAAASAGTLFAVSSSAGHSVEEIAAAAPGPKWFQLYVPKDRTVARRLVERVERSCYQAIIVTVDLGEWKDADRRNRFSLPKQMLLKHLRDVGHEQLSDKMSYEELSAFNARAWDLSISWNFFDWLRSVTKLPLLVKGVLRKEDALRAVSIGLDGIIVSNHGGRRLDGMPASIDRVSEIAEAVQGRAEVLMDGGIRRGTDVLKAVALGAKAVLIGRPHAWALASDGESGVRRVIELLREEFENAMIATGCARVDEINRSLIQS